LAADEHDTVPQRVVRHARLVARLRHECRLELRPRRSVPLPEVVLRVDADAAAEQQRALAQAVVANGGAGARRGPADPGGQPLIAGQPPET
jgi:hypothetical protein